MYKLLKTIIKDEYMTKSFEEFATGFDEPEFSRMEEPYKVTQMRYGYPKEGTKKYFI